MAKQSKWERIRLGLYHLVDSDGVVMAEVERGAEVRRWWWLTRFAGEPEDMGLEETLREAQGAAKRAAR